ncbi:TonB-dependent siderophore receptor, partial [Gloeocapsopsis dulcis]
LTPAAIAVQPGVEQPMGEIPPEESSVQENELIELVVTAEQDAGYRVPNASTATRTDTPLRDIPASIQVVPRQVIEDRGVTNVGEALQNVSGTNSEIYGGNVAIPRLRGFASFDSFFRNGTSLGGFAYDNSNTDNIEQVEVLKGPASVLFGQGSPGGIINLVTKKPLSEPYYNLGFSVGSFEEYRPSFDISGPLNPEKTVLYRFVGSYNRARSFVEFANSERYFLAPSLEWRISPDTKLALDLEFIDSSATFICGVPAVGRGVADIPRSRALCESGDFGDPFGKDDLQRYNLSATFEHRFSQDWSVRNTFAVRSSNLRRAQGGYSNFDEATGEFSSRQRFTSDDSVSSYFNNLDITGNFKTGSIEHKLLIGFELGRETRNRRIFFGGVDLDTPFNIFSPVYSTDRFRFNSFPFGTQRDENFTTYAFYLQDQIAFTDNLKLLLGGRFDSFQRKIDNLITSTTTERTTSVFSPRVGLVYQPIQPVSLYASFVQGFEPNTANLADGSAPPPQKATQYEVGVKADLSDRVTATLAYFDITKTNIPTTDPDNRSFSVVTGEVKSRGVELDISGEISPGWNMIAAYAYTDAFVSQDNRIPVGNRFIFTPRHSFSLWNTYQIQQGTLEGLGFGLGLYYVGEREADLVNSFAVPSYLRTDASIFYRRDNWRAQINFQNVFNTQYFVGTNEFREGGVMPGAPFSVVGSVSITF